jgi:hypothetical protein
VPDRRALGVVLAFEADHRGDLGVHQFRPARPAERRSRRPAGLRACARRTPRSGHCRRGQPAAQATHDRASKSASAGSSRPTCGAQVWACAILPCGVLLQTWRSGGASHTSRSTRRTPTSTSTEPGSTSRLAHRSPQRPGAGPRDSPAGPTPTST